MEKQYFSPERDGFYGVYYPNPVPSGRATVIFVGAENDVLWDTCKYPPDDETAGH